MSYRVSLTSKAERDMNNWQRSGQKKCIRKIFEIFAELKVHPYVGIGHPEPLKGNLSGKWSRQIDKKNRMIYSVKDNVLTVEVISAMGHYDDK